MQAIIIDGRKTRDSLIPDLISRREKLSFTPKLAIIQVGNRPDSTSFIGAKKNFAKKIGVECEHLEMREDISQDEILGAIGKYNGDNSFQGIIVQLPLPVGTDRDTVINAIDPNKDVDALTAINVKRWSDGLKDALLPATARGVRTLLSRYGIDLQGRKVAVIGRSALVGKPIAAMCMNEGAIVTVCHSQTIDLIKETKAVDIIIVAVGKPKLIGIQHVKPGQTIIDVGINTVIGEKLDDEIPGKKLVGDVDFDAVKDIVSAITPVPGGVGPMTVVSLFQNLLDLCSHNQK